MLSVSTRSFITMCLFQVVVISLAGSKEVVTLKLMTTGCQHNCFIYGDNGSKCSSSIMMNGKEKSYQKDGFNILVIDTFSSKQVTHHFRWFSQVALLEWQDFRTFFEKISSPSVVVIVFQNMCKQFHKRWYTLLTKNANIKMMDVYKRGYNVAIVVGCKISCPNVIQGSIPYTYFGSGEKFTVSIKFKLKTESKFSNGVIQDADIAVIAGSVTGAIVVLALLYMYYLYHREIDQNVNLRALLYGTRDEHNGNHSNTYASSNRNNDPVYEEIEEMPSRTEPHENIYADPSVIISRNDNISTLHEYAEPTEISEPPLVCLYANLDDIEGEIVKEMT